MEVLLIHGFVFYLGVHLGYTAVPFLIMIASGILSIILANKKAAWPIFGVAAGINLVALILAERLWVVTLMPEVTLIPWAMYAVLLFIGAFGIIKRRENKHRAFLESLSTGSFARITCPLCGNRVDSSLDTCPHCYSKLKPQKESQSSN